MSTLDPFALPLVGTALVEASAGTGKTHTIGTLVLRLLVERGLRIDQILVVTFTEAATAELRARVRERIRELADALDPDGPGPGGDVARVVERLADRAEARRRLLAALLDFDRAAIHTIHGFCQTTLREHAFEACAPFDARVVKDVRPLLAEIGRDFRVAQIAALDAERFARHGGALGAIEDLVVRRGNEAPLPMVPLPERVRDDGDRFLLRVRRRAVERGREELRRRLARAGGWSFQDLLAAVAEAVTGPGAERLTSALRARYHAALIDEFQDTDPLQYEIFRAVFQVPTHLAVMVGDPKQAIYAFRGADVFAYFQAVRDAGRGAYSLGRNYRSDPSLLQGIAAVFARSPRPFLFPEIAFRQVEPVASDRLRMRKGGSGLEILVPLAAGRPMNRWTLERRLPSMIATEIATLLGSTTEVDGRPVAASDVAVLTRTNKQARQMQAALRHLGVPTVLESDAKVFEAEEAGEVELLLRAMLEPTRGAIVRAALMTSALGLSAGEIEALESDEIAWEDWSQRFAGWLELWHREGFVQAFRRLLADAGVEARLLRLVDGERRLTNMLHLGELLHEAESREALGPHGLLRWIHARRVDPAQAGVGNEASELRLESDARALRLLTIHKSKGLEFPIVYCPYLWSGWFAGRDVARTFHDPADGNRAKLDLGGNDPDVLAQHAREGRAEDLRLAYVALTRAKHRATVVWGRIAQSDESPLAYLLHGADELPHGDGAPKDEPSLQTRLLDQAARRYRALDERGFEAALRELVEISGGAVTWRSLRDDRKAPAPPEAPTPPTLTARRFDRGVDTWWRIGSFTGLVAARKLSPHDDDVERDLDQIDEAPADEAPPAAVTEPVVMADVPRGASAGTMIHAVLEHLDFPTADRDTVGAELDALLPRFGHRVAPWREALVTGLLDVVDTQLAPEGPALRAIPRDRRLDELEFVLAAPGRSAQVTTRRLADAFAEHGGADLPADYAESVRRLGFAPLRGFLTGFVDLVYAWGGRYWVVDYKSNHLGPSPADYAPERLREAMGHAHYVLQYHLYVLALHRYLALRLADYDYDVHVGGAQYLFLRGMRPAHPGSGVFSDRPSRALIEALDEVFRG